MLKEFFKTQFKKKINKFEDTYIERDYLIENIYPDLRKYCKKEHGLDFQVTMIPYKGKNVVFNLGYLSKFKAMFLY